MFLVPEWLPEGPAIAHIPKAGSQSIQNILAPLIRLTGEEALQRKVRVAFIRDPFERLASGYSFFTFQAMRPGAGTGAFGFQWKDYEGFVDVALTSDDRHFLPQYGQLLAGEVFVPTDVHSLDALSSPVWNRYYRGRIPNRENQCERLPVTNYRRDDIKAYYAKDFELCRLL